MKRIFSLLILAPLLGGCLFDQTVNNPITTRGVYELRAGYDAAFLAPAAHYAQLPLCLTGHKFTAAAPCAQRSVVLKLQKADQAVNGALDRLQSFTAAHPTLDARAYIAAAQNAIIEAESLLALTQ